MPQSPTVAQRLERLASDLHSVAWDAQEASTPKQVEAYIEEVERIATDLRATVRGNLRGPGPFN